MHQFPSADLVSAAAGMFTGHRIPERTLGVTLPPSWDPTLTVANAKSRELWPDRFIPDDRAERRELVEGPRWRIMVSPGTVSVRYSDPARADRTHERQVIAEQGRDGTVVNEPVESRGAALITSWSKRSRGRMAEVFAQLDWSPMFTDPSAVPAMVTLTMQGGHAPGCTETEGEWACGTTGCRWLTSAPCAQASRRHLLLFRKRFERAWGRKLTGVWKREFQRRGAPHYHLLMVPPHGHTKDGQTFREWLGPTWANIVGDPCSEVRSEHAARGTGIDYADGVRARDPRSVGVYFAKHGAFADKEYQNAAPAEWVETGSVGRFWGVWGLDKAVAGVEVHPDEARAAVRTLRRHSRANSYVTRVPVWRYRTKVDPDTGEVRASWRRATKKQRVWRMKGEAGFVVTRDGPALAGQLARHLDRLRRPESIIGRSGAGPIGFLP